jgi:aspartate beta-hydroxylase
MNLFYDRAADLVRLVYDRRIEAPPVLPVDEHFPGAAGFVGRYREIRDEALAVAAGLGAVPRFHEIMPEQAPISANDGRDWRMFILKGYGIEFSRNMASCPVLTGLIRSRKEVLSASLSFLAPGKHIPAHRGPFRGVLRFFLVLSMPLSETGQPQSVLRIAGRDHRLHDGECLLWDDTYEHEVWNDSDRVRIVLLLDVWRPRMPLDMNLLSRLLVLLVRTSIRWRGFA